MTIALPVVAMLMAAATPASAAARPVESTEAPATVAVEHTYLKAQPGERDNLIRFIEQNWFVMDAIGLRQGLFTHYALYRAADDKGDWDVLVVVGYPTPLGYDAPGTAESFDAIRSATRRRLVDGKDFSQLGKIIESRRLTPGAHDEKTER